MSKNDNPRICLVHCLLIAGLCLAVYGNTLGNGFVYDDYGVVEGNAAIRQWSSLPDLFRPGYFRAFGEYTYRPLVSLTYMIDYSFWRLKPAGYHLTNLLLHAVNGILLYLLLRFLLKRPLVALAAALLFVVHPVTTEAVNAVAFREDLLAFSFCLLSFLAYLKSSSPASRRRRYEIFCVFAFLLALFAKEMSLSLPLLFLLYEFCFNRAAVVSRVKGKASLYAGLFLVLCFYCLVRFVLRRGPELDSLVSVPFYLRMLRTSRTFFLYLRLLVLPGRLSAEYIMPAALRGREFQSLLSVFGLAIVLFASAAGSRRFPRLFFGIGWFLLALLPVADIVPLYNPAAERYLYFPSAGYCLVLAVTIEGAFARRNPPVRHLSLILPALLVSLYSYRSFRRNQDWKDPLTFCLRTVAVCPESAKFHNLLGLAYLTPPRPEAAAAEFEKSLTLDPGNVEVYNNLAAVYSDSGRKKEAIDLFRKAIAIDPAYPESYHNLGLVYLGLARNEEAMPLFEKAIALRPDSADTHYCLGMVYDRLGRREEAAAEYRRAIEIDPLHAAAHFNLAVSYYYQGKHGQAVDYCERARRLGYRIPAEFLRMLEK